MWVGLAASPFPNEPPKSLERRARPGAGPLTVRLLESPVQQGAQGWAWVTLAKQGHGFQPWGLVLESQGWWRSGDPAGGFCGASGRIKHCSCSRRTEDLANGHVPRSVLLRRRGWGGGRGPAAGCRSEGLSGLEPAPPHPAQHGPAPARPAPPSTAPPRPAPAPPSTARPAEVRSLLAGPRLPAAFLGFPASSFGVSWGTPTCCSQRPGRPGPGPGPVLPRLTAQVTVRQLGEKLNAATGVTRFGSATHRHVPGKARRA